MEQLVGEAQPQAYCFSYSQLYCNMLGRERGGRDQSWTPMENASSRAPAQILATLYEFHEGIIGDRAGLVYFIASLRTSLSKAFNE